MSQLLTCLQIFYINILFSKVGGAEQRISDLEDRSMTTATQVLDLEKALEKMVERQEDLENRSR